MRHFAIATWNGTGLEGEGVISLKSNVNEQKPYTFNSRFKEASGTNPEELIAAAHASDFTMKLSFVLAEAGFVPERLETTCYINFDKGQITGSHLAINANIPKIDNIVWEKCVKETNDTSPIGRALNVEITVETVLID